MLSYLKFNIHIHLSLKIVFILANSADPDEMLPYAAVHLGLHCLPKYLFLGIQNGKGQYTKQAPVLPGLAKCTIMPARAGSSFKFQKCGITLRFSSSFSCFCSWPYNIENLCVNGINIKAHIRK